MTFRVTELVLNGGRDQLINLRFLYNDGDRIHTLVMFSLD